MNGYYSKNKYIVCKISKCQQILTNNIGSYTFLVNIFIIFKTIKQTKSMVFFFYDPENSILCDCNNNIILKKYTVKTILT